MILLFSCTLNSAQIQSADSNHVLVDKLELKYIVNVFNDFTALREINKQLGIKNEVLERIITDKDRIIRIKGEDNQILKRTIEEIEPAWWDKFLIGLAAGIMAILSVALLVK